MNKSSSTRSGVGFAGLLAIAFIVLRLTHVIEWSWWWVLSPIWISFAFNILVGLIAAIVERLLK